MSSISFPSSFAKPDFSAIRKQFDTKIDKDVTTGKISSDDAKAIKSAEDEISKLLDASAPSGSDASFDPSQIKSKIDNLIDGQVKSGKLTSAQADELKSVLQQGPKPGGAPAGGPGGASKSGNALDALFSDANDDDDTKTTTTADTNKLLEDFLKQLQESSSKDRTSQPRLVDYLA